MTELTDRHCPEALARRAGVWLFYVGLTGLLLRGGWYWWSPDAPQGLTDALQAAGRVGEWLLLLRVVLLLPRAPWVTIGYMALLPVLKLVLHMGGDVQLHLAALIVAASVDADMRLLLRIYLATIVFTLVVAPLAYGLGWASDIGKHALGLTGHSWGYCNPNSLALALQTAVMALLALAEDARLRRPAARGAHAAAPHSLLRVVVPCWAAAVAIGLMTLSRTSAAILALLPLLWWGLGRAMRPGAARTGHGAPAPPPAGPEDAPADAGRTARGRPTLRWALAAWPMACLLLSVALAAAAAARRGETSFESRFSIARMVWEQAGLSLFGQDCGIVSNAEAWASGQQSLWLDNAYLGLLLRSGIVPTALALGLLGCLLARLAASRRPMMTAIAVGLVTAGLMETVPLRPYANFTLLCLMARLGPDDVPPVPLGWRPQGRAWRLGVGAALASLALSLAYLYAPWPWPGPQPAPAPHGTVADIPAPEGFSRQAVGADGFAAYLRQLPLAPSDSALRRWDGALSDTMGRWCHRVVDLPLIDQSEQCADVCMRLRADYLYARRRFFAIHFADTRGRTLRYLHGACPPRYRRYLREVFGWANTASMAASMARRGLAEVQAGDVFVYDAEARPDQRYGHAVMVADVATCPADGRRALLLLEGSTPATQIHIVRPRPDAAWYVLPADPSALADTTVLDFGSSRFYPTELRRFE